MDQTIAVSPWGTEKSREQIIVHCLGLEGCKCKQRKVASSLHTVKGFGIVNKAEIDVLLELSCIFHDPADVGNLIFGSSSFSKTSLNIRTFVISNM